MKIPEKVKIGGLTYTVEETQHITFGSDYNGEVLYRDLKINLRPTARACMERTFLHEIIHAVFRNLGYTEHDEGKVDELAGALYALIVDNPEVFAMEEI
jgi:hypothetical protein